MKRKATFFLRRKTEPEHVNEFDICSFPSQDDQHCWTELEAIIHDPRWPEENFLDKSDDGTKKINPLSVDLWSGAGYVCRRIFFGEVIASLETDDIGVIRVDIVNIKAIRFRL